jgi:hypothetical protein
MLDPGSDEEKQYLEYLMNKYCTQRVGSRPHPTTMKPDEPSIY